MVLWPELAPESDSSQEQLFFLKPFSYISDDTPTIKELSNDFFNKFSLFIYFVYLSDFMIFSTRNFNKDLIDLSEIKVKKNTKHKKKTISKFTEVLVLHRTRNS